MAQQTRLLEKIMEQEINPEREAMNILIRELLGDNANEKQVQFCHASIIGQCFHLLKVKHLKLNGETQKYVLDMSDSDAFAEHVVAFSLAGIEAIRQQNNRKS